MYSRKDLVNFIHSKTIGMTVADEAIRHITDILEEIQNRLFSLVNDRHYYAPDKFTQVRAGQRSSKFVELCADENWDYAMGIGDHINKETLTQTTIYQDFVRDIKSSGDYISIMRDNKLKLLYG